MRFKFFNFLLFITIACAGILPGRFALAGGVTDINGLMYRAGLQAKKITAVKPPKNIEAEAAAKQAAKIAHSRAFVSRINSETAFIKKSLFSGQTIQSREYSQIDRNENLRLFPSEKIYIFISSSVPINTLRNYAAAIDKLKDPNIIMVMRGFVDGMHHIRPTMNFIHKILVKNPACDLTRQKCKVFKAGTNVDPMLFTKYNVREVPAIVYATGISSKIAGNAGAEWMVKGDVSLEFALKVIRKRTKSSQIKETITALRRGFY